MRHEEGERCSLGEVHIIVSFSCDCCESHAKASHAPESWASVDVANMWGGEREANHSCRLACFRNLMKAQDFENHYVSVKFGREWKWE